LSKDIYEKAKEMVRHKQTKPSILVLTQKVMPKTSK
jgi:hypothetical protein